MADAQSGQGIRWIYLVRHGQAKSKDQDPERPLTEAGAQAARRVAQWAARAGGQVEEIRHSGKRRAEQTAEIFAESLKPARGTMAVEGLEPKDDVRSVAQELERQHEPVMLVGHLPFLGHLTSQLIVGNADQPVVQFDAAGLVALRRDENGWQIACAIPPDWIG